MAEVKITLTDTEVKSLEYAMYSVQDWCDNAIKNRARIAKEEIIKKLVTHCNENSITIATGEDAQITQAYELKVVDTAKNIHDANKIQDKSMSKAAELANLIGNINMGSGGVNRNVIINGAMNVAQRGTSSTGIGGSS